MPLAPPAAVRRHRRPTPLGFRLALAGVMLVAVVARLSVFGWADPWGPHHPDEHILPLEAVALWEGVTPREVGWPASTLRLVLSATSAVSWAGERGIAAWHQRSDPQRALATVSAWIGQRYLDPAPLYVTGRVVSVMIGILQVAAVAWALSRWTGAVGVLLGTLAAAISPVLVLHSQYVLADVTGVLFATLLVGLAANPGDREIVTMGLLAGLAASSKFHFGLWLLTPLLCVWLRPGSLTQRLRLSVLVIGLAGWIVITLVPWFWLNPLLALKEFAGVVLVKVGGGTGAVRIPTNLVAIFSGLGSLAWLGALAGLIGSAWPRLRQLIPVAVPALAGAAALTGSAVVSGRYGLVLVPGLLVIAAAGWEWSVSRPRTALRISALIALVACVAATVPALVRAEVEAAEVDVDVLARDWILANVPRGSRVAVYDEVNAYLPRTPAQLRTCVDEVRSRDAYGVKWRVLGGAQPSDDSEPFRSALLNDEMFRAYVCARELEVSADPGYVVIPYHNEPRFGALLEKDAFDVFMEGEGLGERRIDVLVVNRPIDAGVTPSATLRTRRGTRVIYLHARG
jgi:hypothetical protein